MHAVTLVHQGWSTRQVARHLGFTHSAVVKWLKRAASGNGSDIPTRSSRPRRRPRTLPPDVVAAIVALRRKDRQYAEVIHQELLDRGIRISLSSVKRTLKRQCLVRARGPGNGGAAPRAEAVGSTPRIVKRDPGAPVAASPKKLPRAPAPA